MLRMTPFRIEPASNRQHSRYITLMSGLCVLFVVVSMTGCNQEKSKKIKKQSVKKKTFKPKITPREPVVKKEKEKPIAVVKTRKKKPKKPLTAQDHAVAELEKMGANIDKDKDERIFRITVDNNPNFKDSHMHLFKHFPSLREINISYTGITDKGLALFPNYDVLSQIYLRGNDITDKGMETLGKMERLTRLCVDGTLITDQGVSYLKNSEALYMLHIRSRNSKKITDACIDDLLTMKSLEKLAIGGTAITESGIKKIRKSLPECELNLEKYDDANFRGQ